MSDQLIPATLSLTYNSITFPLQILLILISKINNSAAVEYLAENSELSRQVLDFDIGGVQIVIFIFILVLVRTFVIFVSQLLNFSLTNLCICC